MPQYTLGAAPVPRRTVAFGAAGARGRATGQTLAIAVSIYGRTVPRGLIACTVGGSFAAPDILSASFEPGEGGDGFAGFQNGSGLTPSPASGTLRVVRTQNWAADGTWCVEVFFPTGGGGSGVQCGYPFAARTDVYFRWEFRFTGWPGDGHKWVRLQTGTWDGVKFGSYTESDGVAFAFNASSPGNLALYPLIGGAKIVPTVGTAYSYEVHYQSTLNRFQFWVGGVLVTDYDVQNATNITVDNVTGWVTCGGGAETTPDMLTLDETFNNFGAGGSIQYDRIGISTQRMGP